MKNKNINEEINRINYLINILTEQPNQPNQANQANQANLSEEKAAEILATKILNSGAPQKIIDTTAKEIASGSAAYGQAVRSGQAIMWKSDDDALKRGDSKEIPMAFANLTYLKNQPTITAKSGEFVNGIKNLMAQYFPDTLKLMGFGVFETLNTPISFLYGLIKHNGTGMPWISRMAIEWDKMKNKGTHISPSIKSMLNKDGYLPSGWEAKEDVTYPSQVLNPKHVNAEPFSAQWMWNFVLDIIGDPTSWSPKGVVLKFKTLLNASKGTKFATIVSSLPLFIRKINDALEDAIIKTGDALADTVNAIKQTNPKDVAKKTKALVGKIPQRLSDITEEHIKQMNKMISKLPDNIKNTTYMGHVKLMDIPQLIANRIANKNAINKMLPDGGIYKNGMVETGGDDLYKAIVNNRTLKDKSFNALKKTAREIDEIMKAGGKILGVKQLPTVEGRDFVQVVFGNNGKSVEALLYRSTGKGGKIGSAGKWILAHNTIEMSPRTFALDSSLVTEDMLARNYSTLNYLSNIATKLNLPQIAKLFKINRNGMVPWNSLTPQQMADTFVEFSANSGKYQNKVREHLIVKGWFAKSKDFSSGYGSNTLTNIYNNPNIINSMIGQGIKEVTDEASGDLVESVATTEELFNFLVSQLGLYNQ